MREEKDTERLNEMREREEKLICAICASAQLSMCDMKKEVMRRSRGMRGRRNLRKGRGREGGMRRMK